MVPCTVVYHQHQPVFGYMAHNTLDGATAIARHRRQPKQQSKCQDPRCCQSKSESSRLTTQLLKLLLIYKVDVSNSGLLMLFLIQNFMNINERTSSFFITVVLEECKALTKP